MVIQVKTKVSFKLNTNYILAIRKRYEFIAEYTGFDESQNRMFRVINDKDAETIENLKISPAKDLFLIMSSSKGVLTEIPLKNVEFIYEETDD